MSTGNNHWNQLYKQGREYTPVSEIVLDKLELTGESALDIGCGAGRLTRQLQKRGFAVYGIDLSEEAINQARKANEKGAYAVGDFMQTDFNRKFDVIFINKVLAFIADKSAFIDRAKSLLTKDGTLVLITPVLYPDYQDKYDDRLKSISVPINDLPAGKKVDVRYFDDYGCELTIILR